MGTGFRLFAIPAAARPVLGKTVFFVSSSSSRTLHASSSSSSSCSPAVDESRNVRVWAWWDLKNCAVPSGFDAAKVAPAIMEAVRANGIKGPLTITAFGDVLQLPRPHQEALAYTGVRFTHVSNGSSSPLIARCYSVLLLFRYVSFPFNALSLADERNSADIVVDLMYWVSQNPPPAHLFLISGDRVFAGILHRLRMSNYNVLLATPERTPSFLSGAATIAWHWPSLLKGENLNGKYFNCPPDGPSGSWYGSCKATRLEKPPDSPNVEVYEPSSGSVPKSVVRQVRHILSMHPKGIGITELRAELARCDVRLDRNLFGHKKFSRFLLSLPRVQLRPVGDGRFSVHLVSSESAEPRDSSSAASTIPGVESEERGRAAVAKLDGEDKSEVKDADEAPSITTCLERSSDEELKSFQQDEEFVDGKSSSVSVESHVCQPPNELQKSTVACDKAVDAANAQQSKTQQPPKDDKDSKTKMDSLRMTSQKSFDDDIVKSEDANHKSLKKHITSENHSAGNDHRMVENNIIANYESGNFEARNKYENSTGKGVDEAFHNPSSSPVDDSTVLQRPDGVLKLIAEVQHSLAGLEKSNPKYDDSTAHQNKPVSLVEDSKLSEPDQTVCQFEEPKSTELSQNVSQVEDSKLSELDQTVCQFEECKLSELNQNVSHSGKPELFSSASFWNEMESFIFAPKASLLFSQSRSREDVVHRLQSGGPPVLRSFAKKDILQLVELLITAKKWLEESPSEIFPFKLTQPVQKNSLMDQSHGTNGLRTLFLSKTSQSNSQKSLEHDVKKHNQSISQTQVSTPVTETKYIERSRNDILEDCQKLVGEILREHPEGYNIVSFRRLFVDKYGYNLDIQKLGYQKLAALLQIMPGIKVESTFIFPSVPAICESDSQTSILKTQETTDSHTVSNSDSELSDLAMKDSNMESPWEELGPVSIKKSDKGDLGIKSSQKAVELDASKSKHPDYETAIWDCESSASEEDSSCLPQSEDQRKPKCIEQNSSFWQAMDLWQSSKEGENSVKKSDNGDSLVVSLGDILDSSTELARDTQSKSPSSNYRENSVKKSDNVDSLDVSLADIFNSSTESIDSTLSKTPSSNKGEKQRYQKKYSFVSDPVLPDKEKLVDGFKKTDESNMQN
ncbi:hypothetical protein Fmac_026090 [Flemingia macrophylla]|uniref:HTH OST-type domain-containing protein n=1 Tax=Flemingia macrophylla TaxID=520843 RepID=A0ABD1LE16_9FABA